jgi:thiamine transport system permease protein
VTAAPRQGGAAARPRPGPAARRGPPISIRVARGLAIVVPVAVIGLPLAALLWRAGGLAAPTPADWSALRFTLLQAALSAAFSVALAIPLARALMRRSFAGRAALIALLGAPFLLPALLAILGLLAVFGRNGVLAAALAPLGLQPPPIYGLQGVVLAHVFFNLPLATRLLLQGWAAIPGEQLRLAASLGMGPAATRRVLERPMLAARLPGIFAAIFLICLSSFAVALILGGGPRATTVELAIYQALRFEGDLARAVGLALLQLGLGGGAALLAWRVAGRIGAAGGFDRPGPRLPAPGGAWRALDAALIVAAAAFLLVPLGLVAARGLPAIPDLPGTVWMAALRSLGVALAAAALTLALALPLAARGGGAAALGLLPLALSPMALGTGAFLLLLPLGAPGRWTLHVTAVANALMALPFAVRALQPALARAQADFAPLAASLGIGPWARWRLIWLPRARAPLGFAAGLAAALSMGDLGVVALFADPDRATLPLAAYRLMGAYQMDAAAGAALLSFLLALALFLAFDLWGRHAPRP